MPRAANKSRESLERLGIPREKASKRSAELLAQKVPGLQDQSLDASGRRLELGEGDLFGSHGLQDLQRRSPFAEFAVHDLAREVEKAFVTEVRTGGILSDEIEHTPDLAPVDEGVGVIAEEGAVGGGHDAGDECGCGACVAPL